MDTKRAKQIINAKESVQVLYSGSPVWLETVKNNNMAEITRLDGAQDRIEVPVYMLVENTPANK